MMDNDLRPGNNRTLLIGLGTLVMFVLVALGSWALLGVDDIAMTEPVIPEDAGESLGALTGSDTDTARVVSLGSLPPELDESSGVAVSRRFQDVVWTHNDGDDPVLFAMRPNGTLLARFSVEVDDTEDWEDIALGPCPAGSVDRTATDCIYVGDVGDNDAEREFMSVIVLQEPDPTSPGAVPAVATIRFRYPDGPADTEALAVSPGGDLLLLTKGNDGASRLYRLAAGPGDGGLRDAQLLGPLPTSTASTEDAITGAAVSPDGRTLAIRNHHAVFLSPLNDPLGAPILCEIGLSQPQGEGIDFLDGRRLILTSEEEGGRAPIVRLRCP